MATINRFFCTFFCIVSVISCSCPAPNELKVDTRKVLRQEIPARDLYTGVEIVPLSIPDTLDIPDNPDIDVCDSMMFVLDESREHLIVCGADGSLVTVLDNRECPVTDWSVYKNLYLDILCGSTVKEYDLRDFALKREIPLSTEGVTFTGMARSDENALEFAGIKGETAFDCGFDISRDYYYEMGNPVLKAGEYEEGKFFRYNDSLTFFVCKSGTINEYTPDDFIGPYLIPDFKNGSPTATNSQMSSNHIYIQLRLNDADAVLICNRGKKEYRLLHHTAEGLEFPIGLIYRDVNYFCCPASRLGNLVRPEDLDGPILSEYVLIKYHLSSE